MLRPRSQALPNLNWESLGTRLAYAVINLNINAFCSVVFFCAFVVHMHVVHKSVQDVL